MAKRLMIVQGHEYPRPELGEMTLEELEMASDLGALIPTSQSGAMDARWIRALVTIAKIRAGEPVYPDALRQLKFSDIEFVESENGNGVAADPPPNRAARRAATRGKQETTLD